MSRAHSSATIQNINVSDGHDDIYIYLFVRLANRGLIIAAHYPNCRHFLARYDSPFILVCSFVGNPFATGGGLRKFMGFLHEITRKHNPCPLRRMSPRLRLLHSFCSLLHCSSLFLSLISLFFLSVSSCSLCSFTSFLRISSALPRLLLLIARSRNLPAVLRHFICAFVHLHTNRNI